MSITSAPRTTTAPLASAAGSFGSDLFPIGSLVLRGEQLPLANSAIAALIAVTFDRYRALANESRIEAEREAEQLRATVLDNLAHDFKTPLTAIRAASTRTRRKWADCPRRRRAGRPDRRAGHAACRSDYSSAHHRAPRPGTREARAPRGVSLHIAPEPVDSLIEEAVREPGRPLRRRARGNRIAQSRAAVLDCDRASDRHAALQYLDNACKYAEFDSTITVRADTAGEGSYCSRSTASAL